MIKAIAILANTLFGIFLLFAGLTESMIALALIAFPVLNVAAIYSRSEDLMTLRLKRKGLEEKLRIAELRKAVNEHEHTSSPSSEAKSKDTEDETVKRERNHAQRKARRQCPVCNKEVEHTTTLCKCGYQWPERKG